jgi:hypothetical protein
MERLDLAEVTVEVLIEMIRKHNKTIFDNKYTKHHLFDFQKHIEKASKMTSLNNEIQEITTFIFNIKTID